MISVNKTLIINEDTDYVIESMKQGWFSSSGPFVEEFENSWGKYCNRKFSVAVSNGTTALIAAVAALELKPGDEVLLPNFTIVSCSLAILMAGAIPVPVDCELRTLNMNLDELESKINSRTRAIMIVHMYGHPSYMPRILEIAARYNLRIIEDAAEAHGASYKSTKSTNSDYRMCGSEGDLSTFSFYANKNITTGEGGMVLTNNLELREKLLKIRNLGFGKERNYLHEDFGYQFRLSSLQAALGVPQIKRIDKIVSRKKEIFTHYQTLLKDIDYLDFLHIENWAKPSYWVVPIMLKNDFLTAAEFRKSLESKGIETRPMFLGLDRQPIYSSLDFFGKSRFPNSDSAYKYGLFLPSGVGTTEADIEFVCERILEF
jgi:perosamine synthetase